MAVFIETEHEVYTEVSDSLARSLLEQLLTIADDFYVMEDEDITAAVGSMIDDLNRGIGK